MPTASHETEKTNSQQPENAQIDSAPANATPIVKELGGPKGPEPTRFGDWERKGRCVDF